MGGVGGPACCAARRGGLGSGRAEPRAALRPARLPTPRGHRARRGPPPRVRRPPARLAVLALPRDPRHPRRYRPHPGPGGRAPPRRRRDPAPGGLTRPRGHRRRRAEHLRGVCRERAGHRPRPHPRRRSRPARRHQAVVLTRGRGHPRTRHRERGRRARPLRSPVAAQRSPGRAGAMGGAGPRRRHHRDPLLGGGACGADRATRVLPRPARLRLGRDRRGRCLARRGGGGRRAARSGPARPRCDGPMP